MRLIDADEFANMLSRVRQRLDPKAYKTAIEFYTRDEMLLNLEQMVRAAPTIDPVKHGRWEQPRDYDFYDDDLYKCSICGEEFILIEGTPEDNNYKFCPNCGARMDAEGEKR